MTHLRKEQMVIQHRKNNMINDMLFFNNNDNLIRLSAPLQPDSVVDGPGIRSVVWTQGCIHNCPECHNPHTHSFNAGYEYPIDILCDEIKSNGFNITLSGGDPFLQPIQCMKVAQYAKSIGLNVWAYSGFRFEDLIQNEQTKNLLNCIDVLVDGKFEIANKSLECKFRGSTNQRLIDVQQSLTSGCVAEWIDPMELITRNQSELF